jgi:ammonium transporter, Amt family
MRRLEAWGRIVAIVLLLGLGGLTAAQAQQSNDQPQQPAAAATEPAPPAAVTPPTPKLDSGDTAWMLTSTALVLMMTIPGLALFYGGMVRKKNVLATLMQCFAICCGVSVLWMVAGYSLAFTPGTGASGAYLGDTSRFMLGGITLDGLAPLAPTIPETVYMMFQMTFAIITPALIVGALVDRMRFGPLFAFMLLWSLIVYSPVAHWVWAPTGFLAGQGILDFAGGTVVHINAGVAGLVACLVLGKRIGFGQEPMAPHNLVLTMIGASLLWVGWFGFNAGSAVSSGGRAGMAFAVTHIATAAAALAWMLVEWFAKGKPSLLGIASGAVAGLVAITPASGYVLPNGALVIGLAAGIICYWGATWLKHIGGYDDSLDVWGVHGIGGITGALLTGVFAVSAVGGDTAKGLIDGNATQVIVQAKGVLCTLVWSGAVTFVLLKLLDLMVGIRVDRDTEREGLDLAIHGETVT